MTRRRVLVTGSRDWEDRALVRKVLGVIWGRDATAVLVSGACPTGADRMAEEIWEGWGGLVERHPAEWWPDGPKSPEVVDRTAARRRNELMVNMGADICLAFIRHDSPGASHTARMAERARIPTVRWKRP